jgi:hypothetical protein
MTLFTGIVSEIGAITIELSSREAN